MKKKVKSIKTRSEKKKYNYGLPAEFSLDYDIISHDVALDAGVVHKGADIWKNLTKYVKEPYVDVDCQLLAKELIELPQKPLRYHFSLIVFKICSDEDFVELQRTYPDKYIHPCMRGPMTERINNLIFQESVIEGPVWLTEVAENVKKYFNIKKYKKPIPILIKYGRCGCYIKNIESDEFIKDNLGGRLQHTPWIDKDYHNVFANAPIRLCTDLPMTNFLQAVATKVNEYTQDKTLSIDEFLETWLCFSSVNLAIKKGNNISGEKIKKIFNPKIERFRHDESSENDFYLKNYADYLFDFERQKIVSVCRWCYSAFDYNEKKKYCADKCAKSARNARSYERHAEKRRVKSRLLIKRARENNDYVDKRREIIL